jgi:hypothetical protein
MQTFDHNIEFWENLQYLRRKLAKIAENCDHDIDPWDRCDDNNFLLFSPIFSENIEGFLKNQCYDHIFAKTSSSLFKNANVLQQKYL